MASKLPILIIIPHGGYVIPEELAGNESLDKFDLFFEADACANELFSFDALTHKIDSGISRLFIDLDRPPSSIPPRSNDGVIKKETLSGKPVFTSNAFPDDIAVSNIMKRYYYPFHQTIEKLLSTPEIKLIIECHTMMAVGPKNSNDRGKPRPLVTLSTKTINNADVTKTCPETLASALLDSIQKDFADEDITVAERFAMDKPLFDGYILNKYGKGDKPMLRISISRALFLNDRYFDYEELSVDERRLKYLRSKIWSGIERFFKKYF